MSMLNRRSLLVGTGTAAAGVALANVAPPASVAARTARAGKPGSLVAQPLDGRPLPAFDYSRANRLPREMNGYWYKTFTVGDEVRTAKVYLPSEIANRAYYYVIAVPDGVNTEDFLKVSGWRHEADARAEGLVVLEPGQSGWQSPEAEAEYVTSVMAFYQSNGYFSIFGEHYLIGYGAGAPALEWWAAANPLRVIGQVYLESAGLPAPYLASVGALEYDGTTDATYTTVQFPEGFDLIRRDEVVVPTWYVAPRARATHSVDYWKAANDTESVSRTGRRGQIFAQRADSQRWMTSHSGPITQVAVQRRPMRLESKQTTAQVLEFLTAYTRYENFFAYGNQVMLRPDLTRLGVEIRTIEIAGFVREFMVYIPRSARRRFGKDVPVVFVWPGNTQTDRVFFDSAQWWRVAEAEGFAVVVICEQYAASPISVSHRDSDLFFRTLLEVVTRDYDVDQSRFYSTGQSAGSMVSQTFAIAKPEYFAAIASTSGTPNLDADGSVTLDGVVLPAANRPIPIYQVYGQGDPGNLAGDLWDAEQNNLDAWAQYHLGVNGLELAQADPAGVSSGWMDRFRSWTWHRSEGAVPIVKLTKNDFRSHNNIPEETPLLWEFLRHYRHEVAADGSVRRWYSPSGFEQPDDAVEFADR